MKMKKITVFAVLGLSLTLSACEVSEEERAACEADGNTVEKAQFETQKKGSKFWDSAVESGDLHFCSSPQGHIMEVYNDVVTEPSRGLFGDSKDNLYVFGKCEEMGGITYETVESSGDSSETRFACVQDGRVLSFESRD